MGVRGDTQMHSSIQNMAEKHAAYWRRLESANPCRLNNTFGWPFLADQELRNVHTRPDAGVTTTVPLMKTISQARKETATLHAGWLPPEHNGACVLYSDRICSQPRLQGVRWCSLWRAAPPCLACNMSSPISHCVDTR